ncbi:hypothetical protein RND71_017609 [Anisodus tanguticus]|uniref:GST N-terminal domain-containing protein n=1 Tax=Anisodus tanguticus TaxID=243964 RepID=A0AAE1S2J6_9SOLA|nr:hypothetical protein RND71_017609 [Anisodus tanguticus]
MISHASATHDNAFTELLVVAYARVQVELDKNFAMSVSNKLPEFLQLNPIGQVLLLDALDSLMFESNAIARYVTELKSDNPLLCNDFYAIEIAINIGQWLNPRLCCGLCISPDDVHARVLFHVSKVCARQFAYHFGLSVHFCALNVGFKFNGFTENSVAANCQLCEEMWLSVFRAFGWSENIPYKDDNTCYICFEPDFLGASLVIMSSQVAHDAQKGNKETVYVKMMASLLTPMKEWSEKMRRSYNENFSRCNVELMENILPLLGPENIRGRCSRTIKRYLQWHTIKSS